MSNAEILPAIRNPHEPFVLDTHRILVGDLVIDIAMHTISGRTSQTVRLSSNEFIILALLAENPGRFVSKENLLVAIAGAEIDPHASIVDTYITYLHRLLQEADSAATIEKALDYGFRFCP